METSQKIVPIHIEEQMKSAYIDYSMSVIISRALPDVRDGLKPVQRRVLFGMDELGLAYNKPHKKSARIVGEVLGKYHPHGDSSVYETMVRMAQSWSLRYPLVNGQGNFGSMDGDNAAAMRYTEARFERISHDILADLDKETVDFQLNFDDTLQEPTVMPTRIPNLLANGATGIAVGMATNMLPHNLSEVADGIIAYIENKDISITELMEHIKAPDFPTGGTIYGMSGVREAFETGRGRVVVRAKSEIEVASNGRESIIVTELPYQVNKATLIQRIADLVNEKKVEGISDVRDESDSNVRIVIDLKKDATANVVLSNLFKQTALQTSYGVNNVCLVGGRPRILNLKQLIEEFVKFRLQVIYRRAVFDLRKANQRAHIIRGLLAALDRLDEVISLIRASANADEAKKGLMAMDFSPRGGDALDTFLRDFPLENNRLSEIQAKEILDMRLQRLTGLERDKLIKEFQELQILIVDLQDIVNREERRYEIVRTETEEVKDKYGDLRRTDIAHVDGEISIADMIENEEVVVTISHLGYIKRTPLVEYRTQARGGRGAKAAETRDEDFIEHIFITQTHNCLLLFTRSGRCYWLNVYEIPKGTKTSKGRAMQNLLQMPEDDKIKAYIPLEKLNDQAFLDSHYIMFCTRQGIVKKTELSAYSRKRANGIHAISIREDDELLDAKLTNGTQHILLASLSGKAIRFPEDDVRSMGRGASGVKGMTLGEGDETTDDAIVGMVCVNEEDKEITILAVSEKGVGKRTELEEYRIQSRGGKGIKTINITEKTGNLIAIRAVKETDHLMIINKSGLTIRLLVKELPISGRATQGVRLINLRGDDEIADLGLIPGEYIEEEEIENTDNNTNE